MKFFADDIVDIADLKRDGETSTAGDGGADGISSL